MVILIKSLQNEESIRTRRVIYIILLGEESCSMSDISPIRDKKKSKNILIGYYN